MILPPVLDCIADIHLHTDAAEALIPSVSRWVKCDNKILTVLLWFHKRSTGFNVESMTYVRSSYVAIV